MLVLILLLTGLYVRVCYKQEHILGVTVSLFEEASAQVYQRNLCAENTLKQEMHFETHCRARKLLKNTATETVWLSECVNPVIDGA